MIIYFVRILSDSYDELRYISMYVQFVPSIIFSIISHNVNSKINEYII